MRTKITQKATKCNQTNPTAIAWAFAVDQKQSKQAKKREIWKTTLSFGRCPISIAVNCKWICSNLISNCTFGRCYCCFVSLFFLLSPCPGKHKLSWIENSESMYVSERVCPRFCGNGIFVASFQFGILHFVFACVCARKLILIYSKCTWPFEESESRQKGRKWLKLFN